MIKQFQNYNFFKLWESGVGENLLKVKEEKSTE